MKNIMLLLAFVLCGSIYAQDAPKDKKKETETKTVKVKSEGKTVEQKVKVTTTEEQDIETKEDPSHFENMDRVDTPKKVTTTMSIDYDNDPFFDSAEEIQYYNNNGKSYIFKPDNSGFMMRLKDNDTEMYGRARLSSNSRLYLIDLGTNTGVGYFKDNGKFVVEYYDKSTNTMVTEEFDGIDQ